MFTLQMEVEVEVENSLYPKPVNNLTESLITNFSKYFSRKIVTNLTFLFILPLLLISCFFIYSKLSNTKKNNFERTKSFIYLTSSFVSFYLFAFFTYFFLEREVLSKGIRNHGNTCFFNSSIQCLLSIPEFVELFESKNFNSTDQPVCFALKKFISEYKNSTGSLDASDLIASLQSHINLFNGEQQDASEFIFLFFSKIEDEYRRYEPFIWDNFKNLFTCEITMDFGSRVIPKILGIKNFNLTVSKSLEESANNFIKNYHHNPFNSINNNNNNTGISRNSITKFPEYFVFTLIRRDLSNLKLNSPIHINESITLNFKYDLVSMICHDGNVSSGHYYSFGKRENSMFKFNDRIVTNSDTSLDNNSPVILVYKRSRQDNSV